MGAARVRIAAVHVPNAAGSAEHLGRCCCGSRAHTVAPKLTQLSWQASKHELSVAQKQAELIAADAQRREQQLQLRLTESEDEVHAKFD